MRTRLIILVLGVGLGLGALGVKRLVEISTGATKQAPAASDATDKVLNSTPAIP